MREIIGAGERASSTRAQVRSSNTLIKKDSLTLEGRVTVPRSKKVFTVKELLIDKTEPDETLNQAVLQRNPITGEGMPTMKHQSMYASSNRRKDGNPLLGIGYGKDLKQSFQTN